MSNFTIYDSTGTVLRTGSVPDHALELQAKPGEFMLPLKVGERDRIDPLTKQVIADALPAQPVQPVFKAPAPVPTYVAQRKRAYPTVEQQLDWLWHAMDDDAMTKVEPFYSQIAAVKGMFPKAIDISDGAEFTEDL